MNQMQAEGHAWLCVEPGVVLKVVVKSGPSRTALAQGLNC